MSGEIIKSASISYVENARVWDLETREYITVSEPVIRFVSSATNVYPRDWEEWFIRITTKDETLFMLSDVLSYGHWKANAKVMDLVLELEQQANEVSNLRCIEEDISSAKKFTDIKEKEVKRCKQKVEECEKRIRDSIRSYMTNEPGYFNSEDNEHFLEDCTLAAMKSLKDRYTTLAKLEHEYEQAKQLMDNEIRIQDLIECHPDLDTEIEIEKAAYEAKSDEVWNWICRRAELVEQQHERKVAA